MNVGKRAGKEWLDSSHCSIFGRIRFLGTIIRRVDRPKGLFKRNTRREGTRSAEQKQVCMDLRQVTDGEPRQPWRMQAPGWADRERICTVSELRAHS